MDLVKLRYFIAAAETGSFTAAAQREFTSQPNVSKQISALEQELGAKLFVREKRAARLTKAGSYFYEQVRALPEELDRVTKTTQALSRGDMGGLTIGLLVGQRLNAEIMERFNRFASAYPHIHYELERASFSGLKSGLAGGQYDIILTLSFEVKEHPEWMVEPIQSQSMAMFVSRMSPFNEIRDLAEAPFIAISPKESFSGFEQLLHFCRSRGFEPNIVRLADSPDSIHFYVEAGVGVAVLDRNNRLEHDQNIRVIPMDDAEASYVVAMWRRENTNPNIQKMVDCLKGL